MRNFLTTQEWIDRAKAIHGAKYDYSCVEYSAYLKKVVIICSKHGAFSQLAGGHLQGRGCSKCYSENRLVRKTKVPKGTKVKNKYMTDVQLVRLRNGIDEIRREKLKCEK